MVAHLARFGLLLYYTPLIFKYEYVVLFFFFFLFFFSFMSMLAISERLKFVVAL